MTFEETLADNRQLAKQLVENLLAMKTETAEIPIVIDGEEYTVKIAFA